MQSDFFQYQIVNWVQFVYASLIAISSNSWMLPVKNGKVNVGKIESVELRSENKDRERETLCQLWLAIVQKYNDEYRLNSRLC